MPKGTIYPAESSTFDDPKTGARIRQITRHPSIHHHPFFFVPAYDDAMRRLIFTSERTGAPLGTVKSRMHHAKRALREQITEGKP